MNISSRTPEGFPNRCPVCDANVVIEPSVLIGDAPCTACGSLLWSIHLSDQQRIYERGGAPDSFRASKKIIQVVAEHLGVEAGKVANNPHLFEEIGADSLDAVELVMALAEEFEQHR